jgi:hypothetical protein
VRADELRISSERAANGAERCLPVAGLTVTKVRLVFDSTAPAK